MGLSPTAGIPMFGGGGRTRVRRRCLCRDRSDYAPGTCYPSKNFSARYDFRFVIAPSE
ncbi:Hypothetical protein FKW44_014667 [Caligus rogercresseyi]|uniref:Uncharacterized protein n=1 Tax=Caligus rogercresseyi TaxID=217165 RepID=A0A7T8GZ91_CALRO|nr:Hypothetical protein FKW44_014667 [Caligus rogercresseyi]